MTTPCPPGSGLSRALLVSALALLTGLLLAAGVILFVTLGWAASVPQPTRVFVALPERVIDGDSVKYAEGTCRLVGLDSPERRPAPGQRLAKEAFEALRDELQRGPNTVILYGKDKYDRWLCVILDSAGYMVNLMLVESGFAQTYLLERSPFAMGLADAQRRAQAEKRGIWALTPYESPERYRKRMRDKP